MGRVDEALKRSRGSDAQSVTSPENPFVSAWSVSTESSALKGLGVLGKGLTIKELEPPNGSAPLRSDLMSTYEGADPLVVAQFRRMAASMYNSRKQVAGTSTDLKVVLVTSASPSEGKTLVAVNLALILSSSYQQRVLLVDADLRRPSIHELWGIRADRGLSSGLQVEDSDPFPVYGINENLKLLPAGQPDPDPISGLTSNKMRDLLKEARAQFDWVILDSPPTASVDDATLLSRMVDAVLLVVRAHHTRPEIVRSAIDAIGRDHVFGVVLNGADGTEMSEYGYHDISYDTALP